jgi:hypothetical protein
MDIMGSLPAVIWAALVFSSFASLYIFAHYASATAGAVVSPSMTVTHSMPMSGFSSGRCLFLTDQD